MYITFKYARRAEDDKLHTNFVSVVVANSKANTK